MWYVPGVAWFLIHLWCSISQDEHRMGICILWNVDPCRTLSPLQPLLLVPLTVLIVANTYPFKGVQSKHVKYFKMKAMVPISASTPKCLKIVAIPAFQPFLNCRVDNSHIWYKIENHGNCYCVLITSSCAYINKHITYS